MEPYRNVMELLVEEEISRQLKSLPPRVVSYINKAELTAYALNQLQPLYATTERGLEYQLQRGRTKFGEQIAKSVQRALAAIRRDPIRSYAPLKQPQQTSEMRRALHEIKQLLHNDAIDWDNLTDEVAKALNQAATNGMTWNAHYEVSSTPSPATHRLPSTLRHLTRHPNAVEDYPTDWRKAPALMPLKPTSAPSASPHSASARRTQESAQRSDIPPRRVPLAPEEIYGWDDPLYKG